MTIRPLLFTAGELGGDIDTGSRPQCYYCHDVLIEVQDSSNFAMDYGIPVMHDGAIGLDYGCDEHPLGTEDLGFGHSPAWIAT